MKNCYEILGTSYEAIYRKEINKDGNGDSEVDQFLREKYEHAMKLIEFKKVNLKSEERIKELEEEARNLTIAYEQVKSPIQRAIYDREMEEEKYQKILGDKATIRNGAKKKNAYHLLNILPESLKTMSDEKKDDTLRRKYKQLIDRYNEMLKNCTNFRDSTKIESEIKIIDEAYELIKSSKKREEYDLLLKREQEKEKERIRKEEIKSRYSHESECDFRLIGNRNKINGENLKDKIVIKKTVEAVEHIYLDRANRKIKIKQIGKIIFQNSAGLVSSIDEYKITRKVKGVDKSDTIYTNLSIAKLSSDKITKKIIDPDYYDCVVNQLLSEDIIDGAHYNYGYIGEVEQDENGNYHITLGNGALKPSEKEALTAVSIIKSQEKENKIKSDRGAK